MMKNGTWVVKKGDKSQTTSESPTKVVKAPSTPDEPRRKLTASGSASKRSNSSSPRAGSAAFGSFKTSFDEATKLDLDKEAARIKAHRQQAKNALMNPSGYLPVALDEKIADGLQKLEFEFENLVNDSDGNARNSKFETLGKYGLIMSMAIQAFIYLVGFLALLIYSIYVNHHAPSLSTMHTVMPVVLHSVGIGTSVLVKIYYDFSKEVGHLESMHLIIRSRMWLFPGVLGPIKTVKRSILDAKRAVEITKPQWDDEDEKKGKLTFNMTHFLKRCQFPEFRTLFRAYELYPWTQVSRMKDTDYADKITNKAQDQIMRVFPILDLLDCGGSLPAMINPVNWVRLTKRVTGYLLGKGPSTVPPEDIPLGCLCTRAEEIEEDDVIDASKSYMQRDEPLPWGTLRLGDYAYRFRYAMLAANLLGVCYYLFSLSAYLIMVFGEVHFYSRLDIAFRNQGSHRMLGEEVLEFEEVSEDDENSWSEDFAGIHGFAFFGCILMFMALPFGVQASALMAENSVAPMLVIQTLQAHVANFTIELDQYLTLLAVNKGSHPSPASSTDILHSSMSSSFSSEKKLKEKEKAQYLLKAKVNMTRDMALSWRMGKFFKEVEHDCEVINISVALMVLNFVCHIIPLNVYLFDHKSCIPIWVLLFCTAQVMSLFVVIKGGIECNEMVNEGIDRLLHDWQLKFNMIGWSGGFIQPGDNDEVVGFVAQDPPGETREDVAREEKLGDADYGSIIKAEQQQRIESIVKVLAHYEAENITPFSVLGVTVTRDMLTLVIGFFGGSIVGVVSSVIDNKDDIRAQFMCHRILDPNS